MAKCIFEGLTAEQAKLMAEWFCGAGEQDCEPWFDANGVKSPVSNVRRDGGSREILDNGDVILHCR